MKTRRILFSIVFALISILSFGQTKADTIAIDQTSITRWIVDSTKTVKDKLIVKYYCIYKGQLVSTTKITLQNVTLCEKYKAKCALILITSKTGKKRIVCN